MLTTSVARCLLDRIILQPHNCNDVQERLERTNRLQQKPRKEAGVQGSSGSGSSKEKECQTQISQRKIWQRTESNNEC